MRADARTHTIFRQLRFVILILAELIIDAPDILRLAVHQHCRAWVGRWIEPRPTLRRVVGEESDISNQVAPLIGIAREGETERLANGAAGAVGGDDIIGG
jgi:hypothetical protein